jgi:hypothetical protein
MTSRQQAKVIVRAIQVTAPGEHTELYVEIAIHCEQCGGTEGVVHGHHLRTLHRALGMIIEESPELCGDAGEVAERIHFQGSHTPGKESLN